MEIIRKEYIKQLLDFKDLHYVKVITGIRRCGKSTILRHYKDILINKYDIKDEQIVYYDFNDKLIAKLFN
jgi:predicted AAA+ superfamily ATPase